MSALIKISADISLNCDMLYPDYSLVRPCFIPFVTIARIDRTSTNIFTIVSTIIWARKYPSVVSEASEKALYALEDVDEYLGLPERPSLPEDRRC